MTDLPLFAHATRPKLSAQCERLLDYLRKHRTINPLESWQKCGIYRLAARIHDLRNAGYSITDERVKLRNMYGEAVRVCEYRLEA